MNTVVLGRIMARTVQSESGCCLWTGSKDNGGYGTIHYEGKVRKAHRVSLAAVHGDIPKGMCILHKCDNPACVNPDHLFLGTQVDNIRDMVSKGRQRSGGEGRFGHEHPASRLTKPQADEIRAEYANGLSQHAIARRFHVSVMTISRLIRGISWRGI